MAKEPARPTGPSMKHMIERMIYGDGDPVDKAIAARKVVEAARALADCLIYDIGNKTRKRTKPRRPARTK